jgi:hypothetical protein
MTGPYHYRRADQILAEIEAANALSILAATRKDPEEQSAQPGGARSHRARSVRPLDNGGPYGAAMWCVRAPGR